jgi:hypothetical protein
MYTPVTRGAAVCGLFALASCAAPPQAPTAVVTPGPGKTDAAFQADLAACKTAASNAVAGQVDTANRSAVANAAVGLVTGNAASDVGAQAAQGAAPVQATIQQQYDTAFNNCMFAAGDNVPGMVAAAPVQEAPRPTIVRDPLVRKVQVALVHVGYLHGGADGVAGPKTAAAIRQYETDKGLPVDGVSSPSLLASLRSTQAATPTDTGASSGDKWAVPPPPTTAAAQ